MLVGNHQVWWLRTSINTHTYQQIIAVRQELKQTLTAICDSTHSDRLLDGLSEDSNEISIHVVFHYFASSPVQDHTESVDQQAKDFVDGKHFNSVAISEKRDTLLARYGAIHVSHCHGCDRSLLLLESHKIKTWSDDLMRMIRQCPRARFFSLFHSLVPTRFMPHRWWTFEYQGSENTLQKISCSKRLWNKWIFMW